MAASGNGKLLLDQKNQHYFHPHQQQHHHDQIQQRYHQQHFHQVQQPHHHHHQISFEMMQAASSSSNIPSSNFMSRDASGALDLVDVDSPFYLYQMDNQEPPQLHEQRHQNNSSGMRPPTLNIFPSQPMHVAVPSPAGAATKVKQETVKDVTNGGGVGSGSASSEPSMELSGNQEINNNGHVGSNSGAEPSNKIVPKREGKGKGVMTSNSSEHEGPKTPDPKTLRRLAQNREAARKSRLRKKAYVQQLESSRIRLTQLEQEILRARAQGFLLGGGNALYGGNDQAVLALNNNLTGAAFFDVEYGKWLEEHTRLMQELRTAMHEQVAENDLRIYVENCLVHYEQVLNLKSLLAKIDVLHLVTGTWRTSAERYFQWLGGFRPSHIFKIILVHIEPLTENQVLGICALQQSTQENEETINRAMDIHFRTVTEAISADTLNPPHSVNDYNQQLLLAMNKLCTVEALVRQADHLRRATLHRLHQILTTRQSARSLLAIFDYFQRLRTISSLWLTRPRRDSG